MRESFSGYYVPSEKEFKELWETCTFVFDTNPLLNLYRYPKDSREMLFDIMKSLKDRIWIPYQVAVEYHKNLIELIHNQENEYNEIYMNIEKSINVLNKNLKGLRHSNINVGRIVEITEGVIEASKKELDSQKQSQPNLGDLKEQINSIIGNRYGREYSQEELDDIYKEGDMRYNKKIPPGFKDVKEKKDKRTYHNNVEYQDEYGDLVYWKQLIEKSKEEVVKSIILITDETKEDWILGLNGKKKGPLPQLVQEFKNSNGNKLFYLYNSEQFLKNFKKYMGITEGDEANSEDISKAVKQIEVTKNMYSSIKEINESRMITIRRTSDKNGSHKIDDKYDYIAVLDINENFDVGDIIVSTRFQMAVKRLFGIKVKVVYLEHENDGTASLRFIAEDIEDMRLFIDSINEYLNLKDQPLFKLLAVKRIRK